MTDNLYSSFARWAEREPQRLAFTVGSASHSYGELAQAAAQIAGWLRGAGVAPGERVGILAARSFFNYAAIVGAVWAGATYVPLNPKLPEQRLTRQLQRARLSALLLDEAGITLLTDALVAHAPAPMLAPHLERVRRVGEHTVQDGRALRAAVPLLQPSIVAAAAGAYLMFTSGTTGEPKAILATVANLRHYLAFKQARYAIEPHDRLSQLFEMSFDAAAFDLFMSLNHGASFHVVPDNQVMAPAAFIRERQLTLWFGVPSTIAFMQRMRLLVPGSLPSVRNSIFGGEPLPVASLRAWQAAAPNSSVDNVYGPTEATVTCFVQRCAEPLPVTAEREVVAIGVPYDGMHGAIIGADGEFAAPGVSGELAIAGPQVTPGYFGDAELTTRRFRELTHPQLGLQRWYLTGDLARQDEQGVFHHLGRIDNQIKVSGHRVELEEVEAALRHAAGSDGVAVVAWPVESGSARGLVGFVSGSATAPQVLRGALQATLPAYMVPKQIIALDSLPLTLNGKVDRRALLARLAPSD